MLIINIADIQISQKNIFSKHKKAGVTYEGLYVDIKREGINNPIAVVRLKNGKYRIVDGLYRYNCALDLNITQIPILVIAEFKEVSMEDICHNPHNYQI